MDSLRGFHTAWHISHRSKMILDLIYGYSKPLEKASYYTKSKGRKEKSIGRVFKKLILVKSSYTWNNYFEITFMFSVQSLLVGNGTSVTCLRKSREPITALNVATYVTPLMVRNFWLCLSSPSNHQTYYAKMMPEFLNYAPGVRTYAEKNDVDSVHTGAVH